MQNYHIIIFESYVKKQTLVLLIRISSEDRDFLAWPHAVKILTFLDSDF